MHMQIKAFASLMGVSVRTLHYYDEIGLLGPTTIDPLNGYRYYDERAIRQMREIMFYRELGFSLKQIQDLMNAPDDRRREALLCQKTLLEEKICSLKQMLADIEMAGKGGNVRLKRGEEASLTARMAAFGRAYHFETAEKPVFQDRIARQLIGNEAYAQMAGYILGGIDFFAPEKKAGFVHADDMLRYLVNTQIAPTLLARARYCEDSLQTAARTGTSQYVILGAGLDTFALREEAFAGGMQIFEVDHPASQQDKRERIRRAGLNVPENLRFVPVDFETDSLMEALMRAGFNRHKKTFFSWLGVSFYLSGEAIERMLSALRDLSAEGSTLVLDYADEGLFSSDVKRVQNMMAMAAAGGEPMKSCFSYREMEALLEKHGFLIYEHLAPHEIQSQYFDNRADGLTAFEHMNYVLAAAK